MIAYLHGIIESIEETSVIIDVRGIGYEVYMPYSHGIPSIGEEVKVYIHEQIKEDAHDLYGFLTKNQKQLFRKLISVNGIGPKSGVQVLNMYGEDELITIILNQDSKALGKVSGIGPKTAQRIILELKDSIAKLNMPDLSLLTTGLKEQQPKLQDEAVDALMALGYHMSEAKKAVSAIYDPQDTTETLIKKALTLLM